MPILITLCIKSYESKNSAPDNRGRFKSVFVPSRFNASFFPRFILKVVILSRLTGK